MGQKPEGTLVLGFTLTKIIFRVLCQPVEEEEEEEEAASLSPPLPLVIAEEGPGVPSEWGGVLK